VLLLLLLLLLLLQMQWRAWALKATHLLLPCLTTLLPTRLSSATTTTTAWLVTHMT
jgi:hypothetical protein